MEFHTTNISPILTLITHIITLRTHVEWAGLRFCRHKCRVCFHSSVCLAGSSGSAKSYMCPITHRAAQQARVWVSVCVWVMQVRSSCFIFTVPSVITQFTRSYVPEGRESFRIIGLLVSFLSNPTNQHARRLGPRKMKVNLCLYKIYRKCA